MDNEQNKILIVDDVEDVRQGLSQILQDENYIVTTAANGKEAIKILQSEHIDLIITDILMPEMDGIELLKQAKELELSDIQYILISGGGRKSAGDYDYLATTKKLTGVNNLLKKPFKPEELIELVDTLLNN